MGVGSVATRLLADFGAEVIKVEDRTRIDTPRKLPLYKGESARNFGEEVVGADPDKGGLFNNYCRNKLGVTINMRSAEGRALAERLIAASSVVTENFAPGVMERWGLTYERLRELRPDVIYARMSGYGHSGPHASYRSYGPVVQAVSGLSFSSGLPGREPSGWGLSYMDNQAAFYNSAAILMAIRHRMLTGEGTEVDVSAVETGIGLLGPVLLEVTVNGRVTRGPDYPAGNRLEHPPAAPHGVYPASGEDRWVAIAVFSDEEWSRFADAIGRPPWTADERFASQRSRWENQDALDEAVATWTSQRDRHAGDRAPAGRAAFRAGAVQNAQDLNETDPQLAHRRGLLPAGSSGDRRGPVRGRPGPVSTACHGQLAVGPAAGRGQRVRVQRAARRRRRRVRRARCHGDDLMTKATPYGDLTVVELAGDPAGEALGKLLATMGADVIKVEPPEGAPSRRIGPAAAGARHGDPDASLNFWFYNVGKRSAVLDYRTTDGMRQLRGLLHRADIVITGWQPAEWAELGIAPADLRAAAPGLIVINLSPFGLDGPWADWPAPTWSAWHSAAR